MQTIETITSRSSGKANYRPDRNRYSTRLGKKEKDYGAQRYRNDFLKTTFSPVAPENVTREWNGEKYNLITQENYEFLRDSFFRYAELLGKKAKHKPGKSIGDSIRNLYSEMKELIGEDLNLNFETQDNKLYFSIWKYNDWPNCTLYWFPVKFLEKLNPNLKRIAITFLHDFIKSNRINTLFDTSDFETILDCMEQDIYFRDDKFGKRVLRIISEYDKKGKVFRLMERIENKRYYKNLERAIERYSPQDMYEKNLTDLMREGLQFIGKDKPAIMDFDYYPDYKENEGSNVIGLNEQILLTYTDDKMTDDMIESYNYREEESYAVSPVTTLNVSPDLDHPFSINDYPERFRQWAEEFINLIYIEENESTD